MTLLTSLPSQTSQGKPLQNKETIHSPLNILGEAIPPAEQAPTDTSAFMKILSGVGQQSNQEIDKASASLEIMINEAKSIEQQPNTGDTTFTNPTNDRGKNAAPNSNKTASGKVSEYKAEEILEAVATMAVKDNIKSDKKASVPSRAQPDVDSILDLLPSGTVTHNDFQLLSEGLESKGVKSSDSVLKNLLSSLGYKESFANGEQQFVKEKNKANINFPIKEVLKSNKEISSFIQKHQAEVSTLVKSTSDVKGLKLDFPNSVLAKEFSLGSGQKIETSSPSPMKVDHVFGSPLSKQSGSEWAPVSVDKSTVNWNKELVSALGDRLKMQVSQNVKEASVRLDPPDLGKVDFSVRMEGDRITVNINSNNSQVRDLLAQQLDRLRSDLSSGSSGSVDVNVGNGKDEQPGNRESLMSSNGLIEESIDNASFGSNEQPAQSKKENSWLSTSA